MSVRRFSFCTAWATNTRLPQTMGEEFPRSGKSTLQRTFSFVLHFSGRFFSEEAPVPSGPRQPGQLPAVEESAAVIVRRTATRAANEFFMRFCGFIFFDSHRRQSEIVSGKMSKALCQQARAAETKRQKTSNLEHPAPNNRTAPNYFAPWSTHARIKPTCSGVSGFGGGPNPPGPPGPPPGPPG